MTIEKKKEYIMKFVCQGIELSNAYRLTYCEQSDIDTIEKDKKFIAEIEDVLMTLSLNRVENYNSKVDLSVLPGDELKRMSNVMNIIKRESLELPTDLNLTIVKQRGPDLAS